MPEWVKWFFDGLGTEIISLVIGGIVGGLIGFRRGKRSKLIKSQKAGNNAKQVQSGFSYNTNTNVDKIETDNFVKQIQFAGDDVEQSQIGGS